MNERQMLARRRELVELSARMQRSAIRARLDRLQSNKLPLFVSLAARFVRRPWTRAATLYLLGRLVRGFFKRPGPSASKDESRS
jgi:hypothetical protein